MNYYRCVCGSSSGETGYEADYTASVNNELQTTNFYHFIPDFYENRNSFNGDIIVGDKVLNCSYLLEGCKGFGGNIYFKGNEYRELSVFGMLAGTNNSLRKNLYFNVELNRFFRGTMTLVNAYIQWSTTTNCFYNTQWNIYCYYNYSG